MKVRAIRLGYYGHKRRAEGDEFELEPIKRERKDKEGRMRLVTISAEQQFSERWMVRTGPEPTAPVVKEAPVLREPATISQVQKEASSILPKQHKPRGKAKPPVEEVLEEPGI